MKATALVLDTQHRGRAFTVDVAPGTRPLAALGRETAPLGHRETEGHAWFVFVEAAAQPDRTWTNDTALWKLYVDGMLAGWEPPARDVDVFSFGSSPEQAARLAHHVLKGKKRGTTGWVAAMKNEGWTIPTVGMISIVTDGYGIPLCAIETMRTEHKPFRDATVEIAIAEDEGDRSLEDWREGHRAYFEAEGTRLGLRFDDDSEIFHEYYRVLKIFAAQD